MISCHFVGLAEAADLNERSFISVKAGESVTLSCKVEKSDKNVKAWYKQQLWQKPKEVVSKLENRSPILNDSTFSVNGDFSLTVKSVSKDHEGMYFCGQSDGKTFTFFNIIVLAVTGNHITVFNTYYTVFIVFKIKYWVNVLHLKFLKQYNFFYHGMMYL